MGMAGMLPVGMAGMMAAQPMPSMPQPATAPMGVGVGVGPPFAMGPGGLVMAAQMPPPVAMPLDDHGSGGVGSVGGPIDALLDQNYNILNQFKANMAVYRVRICCMPVLNVEQYT